LTFVASFSKQLTWMLGFKCLNAYFGTEIPVYLPVQSPLLKQRP
jgi:hypothetical protein